MSIAKVIFFKKEDGKFKKAKSIVTLNEGSRSVPETIAEITEDFNTFTGYKESVQNVVFAYVDYATWDNVVRQNIKDKDADFCYKVYLDDKCSYSIDKKGVNVYNKVNFENFLQAIERL